MPKARMIQTGVVKTKDAPLNEDYRYFHSLLECPTCYFVDYTRLFRGPCCNNKNRPRFDIIGHVAERDGKCPYHAQQTPEALNNFRKYFSEVYDYGKQI